MQLRDDLLYLIIGSDLTLDRFLWRDIPLRILVIHRLEHSGEFEELYSFLMHVADLLVFDLLLLFGTLFPPLGILEEALEPFPLVRYWRVLECGLAGCFWHVNCVPGSPFRLERHQLRFER